jgi:hypothetical protein
LHFLSVHYCSICPLSHTIIIALPSHAHPHCYSAYSRTPALLLCLLTPAQPHCFSAYKLSHARLHPFRPTGTLIAPDLIATAGHCVTSTSDCSSTRFVFNAINTNVISGATIPPDTVFSCAQIVTRVRGSPVHHSEAYHPLLQQSYQTRCSRALRS